MSPQHPRPRRTVSASSAIDTQNKLLSAIKAEDVATWTDRGQVLGKSEDRAAAYANTASAIDMPTFLVACREWGGRFADPLLTLVGGRWADAGSICTGDDKGVLTLATLLPAVMEIEADGLAEPAELVPHEVLIRRVHALTSVWLEMIAAERGCK